MEKNQKNIDRLYKALNLLYLATKDQQKEAKKLNFSLGKSWLKEFSTIKLCAARQTGHTSAICKFLKNRKNEDWLILTASTEMHRHFLQTLSQYLVRMEGTRETIVQHNGCNFYLNTFRNDSLGSIMVERFRDKYRGYSLAGVIVDCASFMTNGAIGKLYDDLGTCLLQKDGVIIFME